MDDRAQVAPAAQLARHAAADFPTLPDIPRARYVDPDFHKLELEHVFRRTWLFAGHVSEFPQEGSYRTLELPFAPVLLVRGKDGAIRAFLNSCRHRGAPVVREASGCARMLSCQYHGWTYDLAGSLVGVPVREDFCGLNLAERPLHALRCELWGGLIFINFDQGAPPLLDWLAPLVRRYQHIVSAPLRLVSRKTFDIRCNWKVAVEAFVETYHVNTIHRQTAAQVIEPAQTVLQMHPNGHGTMFTPYREDLLKVSEWKGTALRTALPSIEGYAFHGSVVTPGIFPNVIFPLEAPGFPVLAKWPLATDRTRLELVWYGLDWGDAPMPEEWNARVAAFEMLTEEDIRNMEPMQRSLEADPGKGVPLCRQECRLWHFNAELDRCIGAARIPPALRVPDLLRDFVED